MTELQELAQELMRVLTFTEVQTRKRPFDSADVTRYTLSTSVTRHRFENLPDAVLIDTGGSADSVRVGFGATVDETDYLLIPANDRLLIPLRTEYLALRGDSGAAKATVVGLRY